PARILNYQAPQFALLVQLGPTLMKLQEPKRALPVQLEGFLALKRPSILRCAKNAIQANIRQKEPAFVPRVPQAREKRLPAQNFRCAGVASTLTPAAVWLVRLARSLTRAANPKMHVKTPRAASLLEYSSWLSRW